MVRKRGNAMDNKIVQPEMIETKVISYPVEVWLTANLSKG